MSNFSILIPVFNSQNYLKPLIEEIMKILEGQLFNLVLINDGSSDNSWQILKDLKNQYPNYITIYDLHKNYGEHWAIRFGLNFCDNDYVIIMADDGKNLPQDILKIFNFTKNNCFDVVYGVPTTLKTNTVRAIGSRFFNLLADLLLDKPKGIYISNFRCISKNIYKKIIQNKSQYFWLDHLIFKSTKNIGSIPTHVNPLQSRKSNYNPIKLTKFIFNIFYSIIYNNFKAPRNEYSL